MPEAPPGPVPRPLIVIPVDPAKLRQRYRHYRHCAIEEAHWHKRCAAFERLCGGPGIWVGGHPLDQEKLRRREAWRRRSARAMRDLLELLRPDLAGRAGLMRFVHLSAIAGRPLDLSDFSGDKGDVRFVLLSSAAGPAHWSDVT
jgi:hypothetical protein